VQVVLRFDVQFGCHVDTLLNQSLNDVRLGLGASDAARTLPATESAESNLCHSECKIDRRSWKASIQSSRQQPRCRAELVQLGVRTQEGDGREQSWLSLH
jgi:hypothetical protein